MGQASSVAEKELLSDTSLLKIQEEFPKERFEATGEAKWGPVPAWRNIEQNGKYYNIVYYMRMQKKISESNQRYYNFVIEAYLPADYPNTFIKKKLITTYNERQNLVASKTFNINAIMYLEIDIYLKSHVYFKYGYNVCQLFQFPTRDQFEGSDEDYVRGKQEYENEKRDTKSINQEAMCLTIHFFTNIEWINVDLKIKAESGGGVKNGFDNYNLSEAQKNELQTKFPEIYKENITNENLLLSYKRETMAFYRNGGFLGTMELIKTYLKKTNKTLDQKAQFLRDHAIIYYFTQKLYENFHKPLGFDIQPLQNYVETLEIETSVCKFIVICAEKIVGGPDNYAFTERRVVTGLRNMNDTLDHEKEILLVLGKIYEEEINSPNDIVLKNMFTGRSLVTNYIEDLDITYRLTIKKLPNRCFQFQMSVPWSVNYPTTIFRSEVNALRFTDAHVSTLGNLYNPEKDPVFMILEKKSEMLCELIDLVNYTQLVFEPPRSKYQYATMSDKDFKNQMSSFKIEKGGFRILAKESLCFIARFLRKYKLVDDNATIVVNLRSNNFFVPLTREEVVSWYAHPIGVPPNALNTITQDNVDFIYSKLVEFFTRSQNNTELNQIRKIYAEATKPVVKKTTSDDDEYIKYLALTAVEREEETDFTATSVRDDIANQTLDRIETVIKDYLKMQKLAGFFQEMGFENITTFSDAETKSTALLHELNNLFENINLNNKAGSSSGSASKNENKLTYAITLTKLRNICTKKQ